MAVLLLTEAEAAVVAHVIRSLDAVQGKAMVTIRHVIDVHDTARGSLLVINHCTAEYENYESRSDFLRAYGM